MRQGWPAAAAVYEKAAELFAPLVPELALEEEGMAIKSDLPGGLAACQSHLRSPVRPPSVTRVCESCHFSDRDIHWKKSY
jgi:hypothetical protein